MTAAHDAEELDSGAQCPLSPPRPPFMTELHRLRSCLRNLESKPGQDDLDWG